jgi:hypothetical protein
MAYRLSHSRQYQMRYQRIDLDFLSHQEWIPIGQANVNILGHSILVTTPIRSIWELAMEQPRAALMQATLLKALAIAEENAYGIL